MSARIAAAAVLTLLGLAACTVNNPPAPAQPAQIVMQPAAPMPAPIVVQPALPPGSVVVQPRSY